MLDEKKSREMTEKAVLFNLNGIITNTFSLIYRKDSGSRYLKHGVYEKDEKTGEDKMIFEHGRMIYWCPDEKTRIVRINDDNLKEFLVVIDEKGQNPRAIPIRSSSLEPLCLSWDRKTLAISDKGKLKILYLKNPLY